MVLSVIKQTKLSVGSKVTAILLNGWLLPTGGVTSNRVCPAACTANLFINYSCMSLCAVSFCILVFMGKINGLLVAEEEGG